MSGLVNGEKVTNELIEGYVGPFMSREGRGSYLRAARALRTSDLLEKVPDIEKLPHEILILWGASDPFQDVSYGELLAKNLPNARLLECQNGSHFLPEDQPEWVATQILHFLKG